MAKRSLTNNRSKLKLTRRQASLFQKIILAGNQMAELLSQLEFKVLQPSMENEINRLVKRWFKLMVQLAKMLI